MDDFFSMDPGAGSGGEHLDNFDLFGKLIWVARAAVRVRFAMLRAGTDDRHP